MNSGNYFKITRSQAAFILGVSIRTIYRWDEKKCSPRSAALVLQSVATGLPVSMIRSSLWDGWRFHPDGYLVGPSNWPVWPSDLWRLEFATRNGILRSFAGAGSFGDSSGLAIAV